MRIVLLGDLHFYRLGVWPWQLVGKRLFGQMNLWLRRRRVFDMGRWDAIEKKVLERKPDRLLFVGDLVTTALPSEFELARERLSPLLNELSGQGVAVVMVPGNHDKHSFRSARRRMLWQAFPGLVPEIFPQHWRLHEGAHLIAMDAARPNVISDKGEIGLRQLHMLKVILSDIPEGDRVMLLCHYTLGSPPLSEGHREAKRHRMIDEDDVREILAASGRNILYLHGHVHRPWVWRVKAAPNVVALNAGAPMMRDRRFPRGQGFWSIDTEDGWVLTHHALNAEGDWEDRSVPLPDAPDDLHAFG